MPNWVTNVVRIHNRVEEFKKNFFIEEEGETVFDFNKIIPMPKDLMITSGSDSYEYLDNNTIKELFIKTLMPSDTQETFVDKVLLNIVKEGITLTDDEEAKNRELDRVSNQAKGYFNMVRYGYQDWYDWSRAKWGTKWNACDTVITVDYCGELCFTFNTAWCTPEGVFRKLAQMGYEFTVAFADEDIGNNVGLLRTKDNDIEFYDLTENNNPHILAIAIKGSNLYEDEIMSVLDDYEVEYTEEQVKEAVETLQDYVPSY